MLYALSFIIKLTVLIALLIWVGAQQGSVHFAWMAQGDEYALQTTLGVFGIAGLIALFVMLTFYKAILTIGFKFRTWSLRRINKKQGKAQKYIVQSLSAIAAGDGRMASKFAQRARKLQNQDHGATDFLDGLIARLRHDHDKAQQHFLKLAQQKHSSMLGVRGLMQMGLDAGQVDRALYMAERAYKMHPKQRWIVKTLYGLYVQKHTWEKAEGLLKSLVHLNVMTAQQAQSDRGIILLAKARIAEENGALEEAYGLRSRAYKIDKKSLPVALALLADHLKLNQKRKAKKLIEAMWPLYQHPQFLEGWKALMPKTRHHDTAKYMNWFERLLALKPDSDEAQLALAEAALHEKMYEQARVYLNAAEKIKPSKKLYRLYARLEKTQHSGLNGEEHDGDHSDPQVIQDYLDCAVDAPENKKWVCKMTGTVYPQWSTFAMPHNGFNTIVWDYPEKYSTAVPQGASAVTSGHHNDGLHDRGALFSVLSPSEF